MWWIVTPEGTCVGRAGPLLVSTAPGAKSTDELRDPRGTRGLPVASREIASYGARTTLMKLADAR